MKHALKRPRLPRAARHQRGALLIEVLVSIVLCAFALMAFASMQGRASSAEFEALQRSQALVLAEDMGNRIGVNRAAASSYVQTGLVGSGSLQNCAALTGAARDVCDWSNLIRGSAEQTGGTAIGAMLGARGCIVRAAGSSDRYIISVAWLGLAATGAPTAPCGQGQSDFPNEALRRVVSVTVCVASLRDPVTAPAMARC